MKKHFLYLILLLTCSLQSVAQSGVQYQGTVYSKVMTRGIYGADSGIVITPSDTFNKLVPVGTIRFLTDFSEFVFTGAYWKLISAPSLSNYMRYADSAAMLSPYARKSLLADTALAIQGRIDAKQATLVSGTNIKTINGNTLLGSGDITISGGGGATDTASLSTRIDARVKYTDTASMLIGYVRSNRLADTAAAIRSSIPSVSGKVNYTDTATMLGNYARKTLVADTAAAIRSAIPSVTGKLNISDTAAMLATYAKIQRLLDTALAIQSRLNLKLNIANPTATGTLTAPAITISSLTAGSASDSVVTVNATTGVLYRRAFPSGGSSGGTWLLGGNLGTTAGTNYIGTGDAVDVYFKGNNKTFLYGSQNHGLAGGLGASVSGGVSPVALGYDCYATGAATASGVACRAEASYSAAYGINARVQHQNSVVIAGTYGTNAFSEGEGRFKTVFPNGHKFNSSDATVRLEIKSSGIVNITNTPTYADNTAALAGGLVAGDIYRTSTGVLMIVY